MGTFYDNAREHIFRGVLTATRGIPTVKRVFRAESEATVLHKGAIFLRFEGDKPEFSSSLGKKSVLRHRLTYSIIFRHGHWNRSIQERDILSVLSTIAEYIISHPTLEGAFESSSIKEITVEAPPQEKRAIGSLKAEFVARETLERSN
ncbi:hypothetical protein J7K18_03480 [bacterium]|nr:hypothetical protein [bacterium]